MNSCSLISWLSTGHSSPVEVYFTRQSGYLSITEADPPPTQQQSCVVFVGLGLREGPLKAWLNACRGEVCTK